MVWQARAGGPGVQVPTRSWVRREVSCTYIPWANGLARTAWFRRCRKLDETI